MSDPARWIPPSADSPATVVAWDEDSEPESSPLLFRSEDLQRPTLNPAWPRRSPEQQEQEEQQKLAAQEAEVDAQRNLEVQYEEARKKGYEAGREEGVNDGFAKGMADAMEASQEQLEQALKAQQDEQDQAFRALLNRMNESIAELNNGLEEELIKVTGELLRCVFRWETHYNSDILAALIRETVQAFNPDSSVEVRLSARDFERLHDAAFQEGEIAPDVIKFVVAESMQPGQCELHSTMQRAAIDLPDRFEQVCQTFVVGCQQGELFPQSSEDGVTTS